MYSCINISTSPLIIHLFVICNLKCEFEIWIDWWASQNGPAGLKWPPGLSLSISSLVYFITFYIILLANLSVKSDSTTVFIKVHAITRKSMN